MKTRILMIAILALALVLGSTLVVGAQGGTWVSGVMIQNQSDTDAANIVNGIHEDFTVTDVPGVRRLY